MVGYSLLKQTRHFILNCDALKPMGKFDQLMEKLYLSIYPIIHSLHLNLQNIQHKVDG
jgi:hypothetical protein